MTYNEKSGYRGGRRESGYVEGLEFKGERNKVGVMS